jgi:hypothetical protein
MNDRSEVGSQVALAALLDTDCLELAMLDAELVADAALWATDGASDVLASHPFVNRMVVAAVMSPRPQVRATVAARPDLDATLYPMLASDEEQSVRARVAGNHAAPHAVLDHLAHDRVPLVRDAAVSELRRRAYPTAHAS